MSDQACRSWPTLRAAAPAPSAAAIAGPASCRPASQSLASAVLHPSQAGTFHSAASAAAPRTATRSLELGLVVVASIRNPRPGAVANCLNLARKFPLSPKAGAVHPPRL